MDGKIFLCLWILPWVSGWRTPPTGDKETIDMPGSLNIGGIYSVKNYSSSYAVCGKEIIVANAILTEAHRYSINYVNTNLFANGSFMMGTVVIDSCSTDVIGLQRSAQFVQEKQPGFCSEGSYCRRDDHGNCNSSYPSEASTSAVYLANGFMSSGVAKNLNYLLQAFCMPLICSGCSSAIFDNGKFFRFLLRTYPSDTYQAMALLRLLEFMEWSHIVVLYEDSTYGEGLFESLAELIRDEDRSICIEHHQTLSRETPPDWNSIRQKIDPDGSITSPRIMLILANQIVATEVLTHFNEWGFAGKIQIVGSDGWATFHVPSALKTILSNAVTTEAFAPELEPFGEYIKHLRLIEVATPGLSLIPGNAWLSSVIQEENNCTFINDSSTATDMLCSGNETLVWKTSYDSALRKARLVFRSVYVAAKAIHELYFSSCGENISNSDELCFNFTQSLTGEALHRTMKHMSYELPEFNESFHFFNGSNSGLPVYSIHRFDYREDSWKPSGTFSISPSGGTNFSFSGRDVLEKANSWRLIREELSRCHPVCGLRGYRQRNNLDDCCWNCVNCTSYYDIVREVGGQEACTECESGYIPDAQANYTNCTRVLFRDLMDVPNREMEIVLGLSFFGCFICFCSLILICWHYKSPIVSAATGDLLPPLSITLFFLYASAALNLPTSSSDICLVSWLSKGILLAICHAITLVKSIRVVRPKWYMSQQNLCSLPSHVYSSIILLLAAFTIQLLILITWIVLRTPRISIKKLHRAGSWYYSCTATAEPHTLIIFLVPFIYLAASFYLSFRGLSSTFAYQVWQARFSVAGNLCLVVNYSVLGPLFLALDEDEVDQKDLLLLSIVVITASVFWLTLIFPVVYLLLFRSGNNNEAFVTSKNIRTIRRRFGPTVWVMEPVLCNDTHDTESTRL